MSSAAEVPALSISSPLESALSHGREHGVIPRSIIDRLVKSPHFDTEEFDIFLAAAQDEGIPIDWSPRLGPLHRLRDDEDIADPLVLYFHEIGRVPLLSAREEIAVALAVQRGDEGARRRLTIANLRLVVKLANAQRTRGLPLLDLVAEGNLGLIAAVDRFDPRRGFRFSTYASWWIRQAITRAVAKQARTVRVPLHIIQSMRRLFETDRRLAQQLGRTPYTEEIAAAMGTRVELVERTREAAASTRSIDAPSPLAFETFIQPDDGREPPPTPDEQIEFRLEQERLTRLLSRLGSKEEAVLRIRFGFLDGREHTLAETGGFLGVSRERTRQIEKRALEKLRTFVRVEESGGGGAGGNGHGNGNGNGNGHGHGRGNGSGNGHRTGGNGPSHGRGPDPKVTLHRPFPA